MCCFNTTIALFGRFEQGLCRNALVAYKRLKS